MERKRLSSGKICSLILHVNRNSSQTLLESTCGCGFKNELDQDDLPYQAQVPMPFGGGQQAVHPKYRVDFLLHGKVVVELKGSLPPQLPKPS
jgi:GxxExxY protein